MAINLTNQSLSKIEVRRLNDDELPFIISLQKDANDLLKYYNFDEHNNWLARALKDIREGYRVGFGAFLIDEKDKTTFIGSAIIKKATRNLHVEIKNFIISSTILTETIRINAQKKLLSSIEQFCASRGFSEMEIEFPADLTDNLSFFLDNKYRVGFILESRYRPGDYHYILSKKLEKIYSGDPFDYLTIARWLVHEYFQFPSQNIKNFKNIVDTKGCEVDKSFIFRLAPVDRKSTNSLLLLGACVFDDNTENIDTDGLAALENSKFDLKLYISAKAKIDNETNSSKVKFIAQKEIKKALGINSSINTVQMDPKSVAGLLLVAGSNFKERILNQKEDFYYVVGSGLGYALLGSESVDARQAIVAFCSEKIDGEGNSNLDIWGYSIIKDFNKIALDSIGLLKKREIAEIWTQAELNYYLKDEFSANLNEFHRISLLTLERVNVLVTPISCNDESFISFNIRNYLHTYAQFGISSCYIDKDSCVKILIAERKYRSGNFTKQNNVMISSILTAINLLADAVTITGFSIDQINNWKASLNKHSNETELVIKGTRYSGVIEATTMYLDQELENYQDVLISSAYSPIDKDDFVKRIASRAVKVLEVAEVFKDQIEDYDNLLRFFKKLATSKLG